MSESTESGCKLHGQFTFSCDHRKRYNDHTWDVFERGEPISPDITGMTTTVWTANESWEVQDMGDDLDLDKLEKGRTDGATCTVCRTSDNVVCFAAWFASPLESHSASASQRIAEEPLAMATGEGLLEPETTLKSLVYDILTRRSLGGGISLPKELSWIPRPDGQLEPVTDITLGGKSICDISWQKEPTVDGIPEVFQIIEETIDGSVLLTKGFAQGYNVNDKKLSKEEIESALALCEQEEDSASDDE